VGGGEVVGLLGVGRGWDRLGWVEEGWAGRTMSNVPLRDCRLPPVWRDREREREKGGSGTPLRRNPRPRVPLRPFRPRPCARQPCSTNLSIYLTASTAGLDQANPRSIDRRLNARPVDLPSHLPPLPLQAHPISPPFPSFPPHPFASVSGRTESSRKQRREREMRATHSQPIQPYPTLPSQPA